MRIASMRSAFSPRTKLVIIHDFYVVRVTVTPPEAYPPLLVDSDAVLSGAVTRKTLQPVARRDAEIAKLLSGIHKQQLSQRGALQLR